MNKVEKVALLFILVSIEALPRVPAGSPYFLAFLLFFGSVYVFLRAGDELP